MTLEYKLSIAFQSVCNDIIKELKLLEIRAIQKPNTGYNKVIIIDFEQDITAQEALELGALIGTLECKQ